MIDYTRYAKAMNDPILGQALTELTMAGITFPFGIICTSAAVKIFPEEKTLLWAPWDLVISFQQQSGSAGARAAAFFAGCALVFFQLGANISMCVTGISRRVL